MAHGPDRGRPGARRLRGLAATLLATLALQGCGPTDPEDVTPPVYVDPPVVTSAASGAVPDAAHAYDEAADFVLDTSLALPLLDPTHAATGPELTDAVVSAMTPEAAQAWRTTVGQDLAGDAEARDAVRLLRFHGWETNPGTTLATRRPVTYQSITDGQVGLDETVEGRLEVSFVHRANVRLVRANTPFDVTLTKPLTLWLVPDPADGERWLIDSFEGSLQTTVEGAPDQSTVTTSP